MVVLREQFGEQSIGASYGAVFFVSRIGLGLGSWAGGAIHDMFGTCAWLYVGSFVIGLSGVLPATLLRPVPLGRPMPAAAT